MHELNEFAPNFLDHQFLWINLGMRSTKLNSRFFWYLDIMKSCVLYKTSRISEVSVEWKVNMLQKYHELKQILKFKTRKMVPITGRASSFLELKKIQF